jgi:hypothetical protein
MNPVESMGLETAKNDLSNRVYAATRLIEELEYQVGDDGGKRIKCNGHHLRQEIAAFAAKLLAYHWN